ncbi:MAG: hypothetical protein ACO2YL_11015 [Paracoccaceae bacterium]
MSQTSEKIESAALKDLEFWRAHLRLARANQLRDFRRYKRLWGEQDPITRFTYGFAAGSKSPLFAIDLMIKRIKERSGE